MICAKLIRLRCRYLVCKMPLHGDSLLMRYKFCYSIRTYKVCDWNYSVSGYHMQTILRLRITPLSSQAKLPYPSLSYQPAVTPTLLLSPNRCSRLLLYIRESKSKKRLHLRMLSSSVGIRRQLLLSPTRSPPFFPSSLSLQLFHPTRVYPPIPPYPLGSMERMNDILKLSRSVGVGG